VNEEFTGRIEFCRELLSPGHRFRPAKSKKKLTVTIPEALPLKDLYL
jgi:hypothetical protein